MVEASLFWDRYLSFHPVPQKIVPSAQKGVEKWGQVCLLAPSTCLAYRGLCGEASFFPGTSASEVLDLSKGLGFSFPEIIFPYLDALSRLVGLACKRGHWTLASIKTPYGIIAQEVEVLYLHPVDKAPLFSIPPPVDPIPPEYRSLLASPHFRSHPAETPSGELTYLHQITAFLGRSPPKAALLPPVPKPFFSLSVLPIEESLRQKEVAEIAADPSLFFQLYLFTAAGFESPPFLCRRRGDLIEVGGRRDVFIHVQQGIEAFRPFFFAALSERTSLLFTRHYYNYGSDDAHTLEIGEKKIRFASCFFQFLLQMGQLLHLKAEIDPVFEETFKMTLEPTPFLPPPKLISMPHADFALIDQEGVSIPIHQEILYARAGSFFKTLLLSPYKEAKEKKASLPYSNTALRLFVFFLYETERDFGRRLEQEEEVNREELFDLAKTYGVDSLLSFFEESMGS